MCSIFVFVHITYTTATATAMNVVPTAMNDDDDCMPCPRGHWWLFDDMNRDGIKTTLFRLPYVGLTANLHLYSSSSKCGSKCGGCVEIKHLEVKLERRRQNIATRYFVRLVETVRPHNLAVRTAPSTDPSFLAWGNSLVAKGLAIAVAAKSTRPGHCAIAFQSTS